MWPTYLTAGERGAGFAEVAAAAARGARGDVPACGAAHAQPSRNAPCAKPTRGARGQRQPGAPMKRQAGAPATRSASPSPPLLVAGRAGAGAAVSLGLARFSYALLLPPMRADLGWSYLSPAR